MASSTAADEGGTGVTEPISNPVLNSPYEPPTQHFELGHLGPTGVVLDGRRPSESFIPVPKSRKAKAQQSFDFELTGERREKNTLINDLRREVERWRQSDYPGATPISRKLMHHWADPQRDNRVLFCQREAAETAIFLAEVAGRHGYADWRMRLGETNEEYNGGMPRIALKMATGSGKTVVMAMLIAWQTINKVRSPHDARFTNRFLVITPGITIRDRLRVLRPSDPNTYYLLRDLVPPELEGALRQARIAITNYHAFLPRTTTEMKGVSTNTRKLLVTGKTGDPFKESPDAVVTRVLREVGIGPGQNELVVLNDEAHHCYRDRPIMSGKLSREQDDANEEARVWFRGIQAVMEKVGVKQVYDLSATPFYLAGSGYPEGLSFPWTVSDFSLMDAIESGIVKVPRVPVDDDSIGDRVAYLDLWDQVGDKLPKRKTKDIDFSNWPMPRVLEGALKSLYRSYARHYTEWEANRDHLGQTPPVFILVCSNTVVSKLVYDWIAGTEIDIGGHATHRPGNLELFSNVVDGRPLSRPRTILIDSAQLESGDALKGEFKSAAAAEITVFTAQYRLNHPGADAEKITDEDILREVMNTVGKPGTLGAPVRCVVSVSMLTEGWDANTVSHILGIRAFSSQLLCEQVVGRGLRRRSYLPNDDGLFEPEYANVYGIPFAFIPSDRAIKPAAPQRQPLEVCSVEGREHLRIEFPRLDGYRIELPHAPLIIDTEGLSTFVIGPSDVPTRTDIHGIVGTEEQDRDDPDREVRVQEVAFRLAHRMLTRFFEEGGNRQPWLFPQLVRTATRWLQDCVAVEPGFSLSRLLDSDALLQRAAEDVRGAITQQVGNRRARLRAMLRPFDRVGSTADVRFLTRKQADATTKSEVSHVVYDGSGGNTWEQIVAAECELNRKVAAYVKNDHLGFTIPYVHDGRSHSYLPDFLVRLKKRDGEDLTRTLIVEVSGGQKSPGPTNEKARTTRECWVPAVNNHRGFGRWGYVEFTSVIGIRTALDEAIDSLYADAPIMGDPDSLDAGVLRGA